MKFTSTAPVNAGSMGWGPRLVDRYEGIDKDDAGRTWTVSVLLFWAFGPELYVMFGAYFASKGRTLKVQTYTFVTKQAEVS